MKISFQKKTLKNLADNAVILKKQTKDIAAAGTTWCHKTKYFGTYCC
ncbi:hypothetical protein ACSLBF_13825 [Pseudoalteromonas sp. T1lg65]